jgi:hypothetical protein
MDLLSIFSEHELKIIDIKNLIWFDIQAEAWDWERGAKTVRKYYHVGSDPLTNRRITISYEYTFSHGKREIAGATRWIKFYETDGATVFLQKDITKAKNATDIQQLNKDIRERRIADLEDGASSLGQAGQDMIDALYGAYGNEIAEYKSNKINPMTFENAVRADKDSTDPAKAVINAVLNTMLPPEFGSIKLWQMLCYQFTGAYTWPIEP